MSEHRLDALIAPSGGPAWLTDLINGDFSTGGFVDGGEGSPVIHITVPMGAISGLPVGLSIVGPAWSEPTLLRIAHAYERATMHRRPPSFARSASIARDV